MSVTTHPPADGGWHKWDRAGFRVDATDACVVVVAHGEVDLDTTVGLYHAIHLGLRSSPHVIIDMVEVSFIDSSGLGVLIGARRHALALGGSVSLVQPPPVVLKILVGTQLQQSFPVFASLDEALQATRTA